MELEEVLQKLILNNYGNTLQNEYCDCGQNKCLVRCRYDGCFQYQPTCSSCFISRHCYNQLHWAEVWNPDKEVWEQHDISELSDDFAIQLGHMHDKHLCSGSSSIPFNVTHTNGIHSTRLRFCGCPGAEDRVTQLMHANLFPATPSEPRSAFTFAVIKHFHMHNLQSKCGSFDFIHSLRRLTDNVLTHKVPVCHLVYLGAVILIKRPGPI